MKDFIEKNNVPLVRINTDGIFKIPKSILESKLNLLFILMNTRKGELVLNYNFGLLFEEYLFEEFNSGFSTLKKELIREIETSVLNNINENFSIKTIDIMEGHDAAGKVGFIYFNIVWNINNLYLTESVSVIKLNDVSNTFKTYFTDLQEYDPNEKLEKDYNMLTNDALIDAINLIRLELNNTVSKYDTSNIK